MQWPKSWVATMLAARNIYAILAVWLTVAENTEKLVTY